jgi:hypothetical protein
MVANPEWKAVRSVHLQGGCRAFNGLNNSVELQPLASNGKAAVFATPTYHALFVSLAQAGFSVIGTDFSMIRSSILRDFQMHWKTRMPLLTAWNLRIRRLGAWHPSRANCPLYRPSVRKCRISPPPILLI